MNDPTTAAAAQAVGRAVIAAEAEGLRRLGAALDGSFDRAVDLLAATTGRVIASGMGKSGHIARKIAATLASTGTPAHFVHPAEASHGDLGMITERDLALVFSNSGETTEILPLLEHCRRFKIPLIGVAGRPGSTLLKLSDAPLTLPSADEACPMGLAPTTSTTMALALGDALAVALMERRGFDESDFRAFHPGGALGARLLTVADLMHSGDELPLVPQDAPMGEVIVVMTAKSFGVAGVVDDSGALIGAITDGDLRRNLDGLTDRRAGEVANQNPKTISPRALAAEALGQMNRLKISSLFVMDEAGSTCGLVHIHDCLRAGVR